MGFFEDIQREAQARKLQFLIIGGHAVNFHGVSRETADLDLLMCREDRLSWVEALRELGYGTFAERPNFMQFTAPENTGWPVDLMFVNRETLYRMFDAGLEVRMFDCLVRIPCLEHLLALKLHALKYSHVGRYAKDLLDVESLVRKNKLDLRSEKVREIFLKHGTVKYMSKYPDSQQGEKAEAGDGTSTLGLEFPIDPDFLSEPPALDPQVMLRRSAESLKWRNSRPGEAERRLAEKVDVEFVLK